MISFFVEINCKLEDLDVILVIYEYFDYIKGVGVLVRKYYFDIYVNE